MTIKVKYSGEDKVKIYEQFGYWMPHIIENVTDDMCYACYRCIMNNKRIMIPWNMADVVNANLY